MGRIPQETANHQICVRLNVFLGRKGTNSCESSEYTPVRTVVWLNIVPDRVIYSCGLDLSGFRIASFHIREKVLRICVSREGSQNMFLYLGNMVEVTAVGSKPAA